LGSALSGSHDRNEGSAEMYDGDTVDDTLVETWSRDEDPGTTYGGFIEERGESTVPLRAAVSSMESTPYSRSKAEYEVKEAISSRNFGTEHRVHY
jgi:hypothetical protein